MEDSMTEESKVGQIKTEETLKKQSKEEVDDSEEEESQSDEDAKNTLDSETHLNGHTDLSNDKGTLVKDEVDIQPKTQNDSMKERIESDIIEQPLAEPPQITSKPSDYADFAAIHSFLTMFGVELDLPNVSLIDLEQIFSTNHRLSFEKDNIGILEVLYMKLFRKLKQSYRYSPVANVTSDRLFKTIVRYVYLVRFEQAEQVQFQGYESLSTEQRLKLFKSLCEIQFEENSKFRSTLQETFKGDNASALRLEPFGVEQEGYHIWFQEDQDCNFIVYASGATNENIEEWDVRARTFEELEVYIADLKSRTEVNPKDTVEERSKVVREEKEKEKEKRRQEREEKRKAAAELAAKKKKGKGRGRRAKEVAPVEISSSESEEEEDDGCVKCLRNKQDDQVLLCDTCDAGYHATCLVPPVTTIPEGDWYGPHCMHVTLAQKLAERMAAIRKKVQAKERKSRRMQFYGIRQSNIIESNSNEPQTGRRAGRTKVDYRFSEYDRTVEDALRSSEEENDRPSRRSNGLSRMR
uniref:PHD-type domain-containing protein n=1 Tax=Clytia hemisphaerica TaxID=252671 RepID=A0A7M5UVG7_9CNID